MRVGSVVQLESPKSINDVPSPLDIFIRELPKTGVDYTVETFEKCECCEGYITLDQIPNPGKFPSGRLIPYPVKWFRELADPLGEYTKEKLTEKV